MPSVGTVILEDICGLPLTVTEARELYRRGVALANALKEKATLRHPIVFAEAETTRLALQGAVAFLAGDGVSRLKPTIAVKDVIPASARLCQMGTSIWSSAVEFDGLVEARDTYAQYTRDLKVAHATKNPPLVAVAPPEALPTVAPPAPTNLAMPLTLAGAVLAVGGVALWATSKPKT